jgi:hypothetical protein
MDLRDLVQVYAVGADRASVTLADSGVGGIGGVVPRAEAERTASTLRETIAARFQLELARQATRCAQEDDADRHVREARERGEVGPIVRAANDAIAWCVLELESRGLRNAALTVLGTVHHRLETLRSELTRRPLRRGGLVVVRGGAGEFDDPKGAAE